jgi:hypothetical protein
MTKHKQRKPGLEALYSRIDSMNMSETDRIIAKARLAQADAIAGLMHDAVGLLKRLAASRPGHAHTSA